MTKEEAIKLINRLEDSEHIILAYWRKDMFEDVPKDEWADFAYYTEDKTDWSYTHEQMAEGYDYFKEDE